MQFLFIPILLETDITYVTPSIVFTFLNFWQFSNFENFDFWKSNFWKLRISMKYRIFDNIQFLKFWDLRFRISKIYIFWKFKIFEILIFEILIFEILDIWN